jgi:hypothetical protein
LKYSFWKKNFVLTFVLLSFRPYIQMKRLCPFPINPEAGSSKDFDDQYECATKGWFDEIEDMFENEIDPDEVIEDEAIEAFEDDDPRKSLSRQLPACLYEYSDEDIEYYKRLSTKTKLHVVNWILREGFVPSEEWKDKNDKYIEWKKQNKALCHKSKKHQLCNFVINENGDLCTNYAQPSSQYTGDPGKCIQHGGGNRCQKRVCRQSAQHSSQGTGLPGMCIDHGGGDRCQQELDGATGNDQSCCPNGAVVKKGGDPTMCSAHGGFAGKKCLKCGVNLARISSRNTGEYGMCVGCGGGDRCQEECCAPLSVKLFAYLYHPDTGKGICTHFARNMVDNAMLKGNVDEFNRLMSHFNFKRHLVCRAENAFYFAINKAAPDLRQLEHSVDEGVFKAFFGKPKDLKEKRPDVFYLYRNPQTGVHSGLHFEYDETTNHEDDDDRLRECAIGSGCDPENVYVVRVNGRHKTKNELCKRRTVKNSQDVNSRHDYYVLTKRGHEVVAEVAAYMQECVKKMKQGIMPSCDDRKRYFGQLG